MNCKYGNENCTNYDIKCFECFNSYYYNAAKIRHVGLKKNNTRIKETKRQGSINEVITYNKIKDAIEGTPNSGAGAIKGDLQIGNMAMIECKTTVEKNKGRQPGKQSFSIQRKWLEKLDKEAKEAKKEFWYLVFSFLENDEKLYTVIDLEVINSMIATMKHDRKELNDFKKIVDVHKKKADLFEAENTKLLSEIEYLKALLKSKE